MLDQIDRRILSELTSDGRMSFRELGERVGLSAPAVTERVRRLERDGVITGYAATVDPEAVGSPILVIMRVIHASGRPPVEIGEMAATRPEVIECNRVTGAESHVIRAWCRDLAHLNELIEVFTEFGETITNVVTDTPVKRRAIRFE
ncbi:MAG: Lrp/AsnC family transcriptional regulator [Actinomycetota bacterium]